MDINKFDYKIGDKPVVFDVGGYDGEFTQFIREKYGCGVHVFEPVRKFFINIVKKFALDPLVWPYDVALEDRDCRGTICIKDNSSSIYCDGHMQNIRIRDIRKFIEEFHLPKIDILKLNCEGSEYRILNRLLEKNWGPNLNWIGNVHNIVVQFHEISPTSAEDTALIREKLKLTHDVKHRCDHWTWLVKK